MADTTITHIQNRTHILDHTRILVRIQFLDLEMLGATLKIMQEDNMSRGDTHQFKHNKQQWINAGIIVQDAPQWDATIIGKTSKLGYHIKSLDSLSLCGEPRFFYV